MKKQHEKSLRKIRFEIFELSEDQTLICNSLVERLEKLGWEPVLGRAAEEAKCFELLIPEPNATFSLRNPSTGEIRAAAFHFTEVDGSTRYVCTMQLPDGGFAQERGYLAQDASALTTISSHDELTYSLLASELPPLSEPIRDARKLLDRIVTQVADHHMYVHSWSELRHVAFPGAGSWNNLKAWAEQHSLDCELFFGSSSKLAQVLFRSRDGDSESGRQKQLQIQASSNMAGELPGMQHYRARGNEGRPHARRP